MDREKRELNERLRIVSKRIDHLERAIRQEERPLVNEDYELQKKNDLVAFEEGQKATIIAVRQKHREDMTTKTRLARMMGDYQARRSEIVSQREGEFARRKEEAAKKIEEERAKLQKSVVERREKQRREEEKRERIRREQEEEEERLEEGEYNLFSGT